MLLCFALVRPVERDTRFCFACFTHKLHALGPVVHVFQGTQHFLLLRMSLDLGRKALIDEDGWGTSRFFS